MKKANAVKAFLALGHDSRLEIFQNLSEAGKKGITSGELSKELSIPGATLSFHLNQLVNSKLISSRREGRAVFYFVKYKKIKKLTEFLSEYCHQDHTIKGLREDVELEDD